MPKITNTSVCLTISLKNLNFLKTFGYQVVCLFKRGQLSLSTFCHNCPALFARPGFSLVKISCVICTPILVSDQTSAYDMFMGRLTLTAALSCSRARYVAFCLKSLPTHVLEYDHVSSRFEYQMIHSLVGVSHSEYTITQQLIICCDFSLHCLCNSTKFFVMNNMSYKTRVRRRNRGKCIDSSHFTSETKK